MTKILAQLTKYKFVFFAALWLCIIILYWPAYQAGFVGEFISYLQSFEEDSFLDFVNRKQAYVLSFYQLASLLRYVYIYLFGVQPIPWFLLFTACHALCGTLVYYFFSALFRDFNLVKAELIAFVGTLLFLFNPNISEVTIWKATDHYYISMFLHLINIILVRKFIISLKWKYALLAAITFILSAFALEIFYIIPIITFALATGYRWHSFIDTKQYKKVLFSLLLPQILLFFAYLISFKLIHGSWIAHYGTTDEFVWSINDIVKGYGKYICYIGIMMGHYPSHFRMSLYDFLGQAWVAYSILCSLIIYLVVALLRFKKLSANGQLLVFVIGLFVCSISLCLTIPFDDLFSIYNSRRCYHSGVFFYMAISLLLFRIKNKRIFTISLGIYLTVCLSLTLMMVFRWRSAAKIQYGVLENFEWQKAKNIVLLNVPTYYHDIRMISAGEENEFARQLRYFGHSTIEGNLYSVLGYNMNEIWHGAHVTVLDSLNIKVTLNQWGTWWMYGFIGATEYENELYTLKLTDVGHEYLLTFKHKPDTATVVLFQQDLHWRKVDFSRIDEEQW